MNKNAHRVNSGESFIAKDSEEIDSNTKNDFFFIKEKNQEKND